MTFKLYFQNQGTIVVMMLQSKTPSISHGPIWQEILVSVYPNNAIPRPDDYDKEFVPEVYLAVTVWWVGDCSATPSAVEAVSFYRGGWP